MTGNGDFESKLWKVLEKEQLADLSQYHRFGFFDEVPLYSRLSQVSFLSNLGREKANGVLLAFGIKFLNALVGYDAPQWPFLASLTIWDEAGEGLIVPNIFVCSGPVEEELRSQLRLHAVKAAFSRRIKKLLTRLRMTDLFQVLEDDSTLAEMTRAFIGHKSALHTNMVTIDSLGVKSRLPHRRRAQKSVPRGGKNKGIRIGH